MANQTKAEREIKAMDPNATVQAMNDAGTLNEAKEYAEQLRDWLDKGGFEPNWRKLSQQAWKALLAVDARRFGNGNPNINRK